MSLRSIPNFLGIGGGTTWWNDAIQKIWPQLSAFAIDKIVVFLNNMFMNASSTSSVIDSIHIKSIFLGSRGPTLSNIKMTSCKHADDEVS